jgi:hypothetical protein
LGGAPQVEYFTKTKKGRQWEMVTLRFYDKSQTLELAVDNVLGTWLIHILAKISVENTTLWTFQEIKADFEQAGLDGFEPFWYGKQVQSLRDIGLLAL